MIIEFVSVLLITVVLLVNLPVLSCSFGSQQHTTALGD